MKKIDLVRQRVFPQLFRFLSAVFIICTALSSSPVFAQFPASCGPVNCTSNDVRVISAYLSGPLNTPIDCGSLQPFANAELHLIVSSNTQRIGVSISGTLNANGQYLFANCFTGVTLNNGSNNNLTIPLPLSAATCPVPGTFTLTNLFVSWGTGNTDFCDGSTDGHCPETKAKCRFKPGEIIVVDVKLEVDFGFSAGVCADGGNSLAFDFTPVVTAQNITYPLDYHWNFGDNSTADFSQATAADPVPGASHIYAVAGSYTITLTVTDHSGTPYTKSAIHNIMPEACCDISAPGGADQEECEKSPIQTLTASATGAPGETITWFDAATDGNEVASPVLSSVGTITYYAEASTATCTSPSRTPVKLTITPGTSHTTKLTECDSYTWAAPLGNGVTYTTTPAVLPTFITTNAAGCIHTETLDLTINYSSAHTTTVTRCDSYTWAAPLGNGVTYTATPAVLPTFVTTNAAGCPHTETLDLTINNSSSATTTVSQCGGSYIWTALLLGNGVTYTATPAVLPTFVTTNAAGCPHTQTLNLTINPVPSCIISNTTAAGSHTTVLGAAVNFSGPSGANFKYAWSFSANTSGATFAGGTTTATTQNVTVTATTSGSYTLSLKVTDETYTTNCNATCTYSVTVGPTGPFYTVTQGFYGNVGGKVTVPGASCATYVAGTKGTVDGLIAVSIKNMPGQQLKLGITPVAAGAGKKTFIMGATSAEDKNLVTYLPAGQAADVIMANSGADNNTNMGSNLPKLNGKKISNVLLGQSITLMLNVYIPGNTLGSFVLKTGYLTTQKADLSKCPTIKMVACSTDASAISSLQLTTNVGLKAWINAAPAKTVNDLLNLASNALGGANIATLTGQAGITLSDINNAVDVINNSFDQARYFLGYYPTAKSCSNPPAAKQIPAYVQNTDLIPTELTVTAYPNPYTDKVKFNIVSPVSGNASLDVYNMLGQKVANVYNGYLNAGRGRVIEYAVPNASKGSLIYTLKVGNQQVYGKMTHLK